MFYTLILFIDIYNLTLKLFLFYSNKYLALKPDAYPQILNKAKALIENVMNIVPAKDRKARGLLGANGKLEGL